MPGPDDIIAARLFHGLQAVLGQGAAPEQLLRTIMEQAVSLTAAQRGALVGVEAGGEFDYRVLHQAERHHFGGAAGSYSRSLFRHVLKSGEGLVVDNVLDDVRFRHRESVQNLRLASILCLPVGEGGRVEAILYLEHRAPGHFQMPHLRQLAGLRQVAGAALAALRAGDAVLRERDQLRLEARETRELLAQEWSFGRFVGRSAPVRVLERQLEQAARQDAPVLLSGETGTGKSLLARILHHRSARRNRPFVLVACPNLSAEMCEATLFGARRGAYTGADSDRLGLVQAALGGTLFLDEVSTLPLSLQAKLLRLLQERTYQRVGDHQESTADVRFVAATNQDLAALVTRGRFRRDLYERLNYLPVRVPPLRQRREDIPDILEHLLSRHEGGRWVQLAPEAREYLRRAPVAWVGNVRNLDQIAVRLLVREAQGLVTSEELDAMVRQMVEEADGFPDADAPFRASGGTGSVDSAGPPQPAPAAGPQGDVDGGLASHLAQAEQRYIAAAMSQHPELTRKELAERLGISESALYKKLRLYGLGT